MRQNLHRAICCFILLIVFILPFRTSGNNDSLIYLRKKAFEKYDSIKQSIKVNTWVNLKNLNGSLENLVIIDQMIFDTLIPALHDSLRNAAIEQMSLRTDIATRDKQIMELSEQMSSRNYLFNFFLFGGGIIFLLFLLFFVLFLIYSSRYKKIRKKLGSLQESLEKNERENKLMQTQLNTLRNLESEMNIKLRSEIDMRQQLAREKEYLEEELSALQKTFEKEHQAHRAVIEELRKILDELKK